MVVVCVEVMVMVVMPWWQMRPGICLLPPVWCVGSDVAIGVVSGVVTAAMVDPFVRPVGVVADL